MVSFSDDDGFSEGPLTSAATKTVIATKTFNEIDGDEDNNTLTGTENNDLINGMAGDDIINGGAGDDTIDGDAGINILSGGAGNDIFLLRYHEIISDSGEYDIVTDYDASADILDINGPIADPDPSSTSYFLPFFFSDENTYRNFTGSTDGIGTLFRWEQKDMSAESEKAGSKTNDSNVLDTVIYNGNYTIDTSDDWVIMVLEDFTGTLDSPQFDVA
ncbi:MAG: hypothetical protein ISQ27_05005 [PS1 clade bacterium]|nr:hypothetical protein [PS1 clade bacterium]